MRREPVHDFSNRPGDAGLTPATNDTALFNRHFVHHHAAMSKRSAGILLYQLHDGELRVLLAHPGGPFWAKRDLGAWSIPKGEPASDEDDATAARREFREEIGVDCGAALQPLGEIRQKGGKVVVAFAVRGDVDVATLHSQPFDMEWPPRSGRMQSFPEVDRAEWMTLAVAREKILPAQATFLDRLVDLLAT